MMQLQAINYLNNQVAFNVIYNEKYCRGELMKLDKLRLFIVELGQKDVPPLQCSLAEYQGLLYEVWKFNNEMKREKP